MKDEIPSEAAAGRWRELLSTRYLFATVTVSLGIVLFAFNAFLVSTALPSAVTSLGRAELLSWATSLYLIFSIVGGSSTLVLSTLISQQMTVQLNWPLAGALCSVLLIVTLTLATVFRRFLVLGQRGVST